MSHPKQIQLGAGVILVAPPTVVDPNFRRSVVFLCEHTLEGSFGLVLNHEVSLGMSELVEELATFSESVRIGGPVQLDTLHFLHKYGEKIGGSLEITDGIFWGGELEDLQRVLKTQQYTASDLRFFLGYAGWSGGQLESELEAGGWLVLPPDQKLIFEVDPARLWRESMLKLGGEFSLLVNYPENPIVN